MASKPFTFKLLVTVTAPDIDTAECALNRYHNAGVRSVRRAKNDWRITDVLIDDIAVIDRKKLKHQPQ